MMREPPSSAYCMGMILRVVPAALSVAIAMVPSVAMAKKVNPEGDKLPPTASAGYFLGHPTPTYQWHGCTKTASQKTLARPVPGQPEVGRGSKPSAVEFTVQQGVAPLVSWKVKKGWKICGVQVGAILDNPTVSEMLLGQVGYTSSTRKGSTSTSGTETIQVSIPTKGVGAGFERFEGKTFSIESIQHVTVFIKKK